MAETQVFTSEQSHLHKVMDVDDARHLLTRTGIGARPADVAVLTGVSRANAIDFIVRAFSEEARSADAGLGRTTLAGSIMQEAI